MRQGIMAWVPDRHIGAMPRKLIAVASAMARPSVPALRRLAWLVLLCALIGPTGAVGAVTPAQTCAAAKLKAAGNEIAGEMSCYAKAKKAGVAVDGGCLSTQRRKADARINRADGACSGTAAAIDAAVDNCVAAFLNDDPGNGT